MAIFLGLGNGAWGQSAAGGASAPGSDLSVLTAKLDSIFRLQTAGQPGIALSIEKNGVVLYRNAVGLADVSKGIHLDAYSNFRLASMTKQFTAMGILLLERDHRLSLEDPIGRWLPELPTDIGQKVLIRHLLTHSSGLLDYESLIPEAQTRQVLDDDVLQLLSLHDSTYFVPGSRFRYSNSGFCLLALIIEKVSHQSYASFVRDSLFTPLGMDSTRIYEPGGAIPHRAMGYATDSSGHIIASDQSVTSATKGDGGVYTSLIDYSKWIRALQEGRPLPLAPVIKRLHFPIESMPGSYYAAGWFYIDGSPQILFHSGSTCGFANFVIQLPGDEWHIVYFSNLAENLGPFRAVLGALQDAGVADFSKVLGLHALTQ